jgi:hypothetical protein
MAPQPRPARKRRVGRLWAKTVTDRSALGPETVEHLGLAASRSLRWVPNDEVSYTRDGAWNVLLYDVFEAAVCRLSSLRVPRAQDLALRLRKDLHAYQIMPELLESAWASLDIRHVDLMLCGELSDVLL